MAQPIPERFAKPACELCNGTEWRSIDINGIERVTRCDCWLERQRKYAENVPREFQTATFDTYKPMKGNRAALAAAKAFLTSARDLYLCGPVGSGKSRLAATILNEFYREHRTGYYIRVATLLRELQPPRDDIQSEESAQLERRFKTEPLMVLDDLGTERTISTDYSRRMVLDLYDLRYEKGLRTIWTSNLSLIPDPKFRLEDPKRPPTLAEYLRDDRLSSRISGRCDLVLINCADQRQVEREITR